MANVRGDLYVNRRVLTGVRADEGLLDLGLLTANYTLEEFSYAWISGDPNGADRDVTLPDATQLTVGWQVTVHNKGVNPDFILVLKDNGATILEEVTSVNAVVATLIDNSTAAGVWFVENLNFGAGEFGWSRTATYRGNAGTGTYWQWVFSGGSDDYPYIVPTPATVHTISIHVPTTTTTTASMYAFDGAVENLLGTVTLTADDVELFSVSWDIVTYDEIRVQTTAGSFRKPTMEVYFRPR